jgi:hypothetical protein
MYETVRIPLAQSGGIGVRHKDAGGLGVFAKCPIAKYEIILFDWHDTFYRGLAGWRAFSVAEIEALPKRARALVLRYGLDADFNRIMGPVERAAVTTIDNFLNHSCQPTLGYDVEGNVITTRDIDHGEELTIDYGCFAVNFDETWECQCGSPKCRKRIRHDDWIGLAIQRGFAMPRFLHARIAAQGSDSFQNRVNPVR